MTEQHWEPRIDAFAGTHTMPEHGLWCAVAERMMIDYIVTSCKPIGQGKLASDNVKVEMLRSACFDDIEEPGTLYWIALYCFPEPWESCLEKVRAWLIQAEIEAKKLPCDQIDVSAIFACPRSPDPRRRHSIATRTRHCGTSEGQPLESLLESDI